VLECVFERSAGRGDAVETPIGFVPSTTALNVEGLNVTEVDLTELLTVNHDEWRDEVPRIREHYATFGDDLPKKLIQEIDRLEASLAE
jgi:phosphoenolpyruvate carboxykinase (GTP)